LHKAVTDSGINKKVSLHTLRYSFATHLLEHGTDLRCFQSLLGHKSVERTDVYTHISNREIGQLRSPLDFLKIKDEHFLHSNSTTLLKSKEK